jgi:hypothetical protein
MTRRNRGQRFIRRPVQPVPAGGELLPMPASNSPAGRWFALSTRRSRCVRWLFSRDEGGASTICSRECSTRRVAGRPLGGDVPRRYSLGSSRISVFGFPSNGGD